MKNKGPVKGKLRGKREAWLFLCIYLFIKFIYKNILFIYFSQLLWVLVASGGLLSCGSPAPQLWCANSQLQYACGIQFPDQGSNLVTQHWEHGVLATRPPGKSPRAPAFILLDKDLKEIQLLALARSSHQRQPSKQEVPLDHIRPGRERLAISRRKGLTNFSKAQNLSYSLHISRATNSALQSQVFSKYWLH